MIEPPTLPDGRPLPDVIETPEAVFVRKEAFKYHVTIPRGVWSGNELVDTLVAVALYAWLDEKGCVAPLVVEIEDGTAVFTNDQPVAGALTALAQGGAIGVERFMQLHDARERHPSTNEVPT